MSDVHKIEMLAMVEHLIRNNPCWNLIDLEIHGDRHFKMVLRFEETETLIIDWERGKEK